MNKFPISLIFWLLMCGITSCSGDDDPVEVVNDDHYDLMERNLGIKNFIIEDLCIVNKSELGVVSYEPRRGKAIDSTTPTIYYVPVDSDDEPLQIYNSIASICNTDTLNPKDPERDITILDSRIAFSDGNASAGEKGRISVDIPELRNVLTEIVFITREKWPYNDYSTPFNHLSLWYHESSQRYFICVRPSSGCKGIMLTFDGGWMVHMINEKLHYLKGEPFYLYYNTAPKEAFDCLVTSLNDKPDRGKKLLDKIKEKILSQKPYHSIKALRNVIEHESQHMSEDRGYWFDLSFSAKRELCKGFYCWRTHIYRVAIKYKNGKYLTESIDSYYEHEQTPYQDTPSWAFYFDSNMSTNGFEPILF